jgi:Centromere DNA-binding protein complex CBF3 subunit, domain 2
MVLTYSTPTNRPRGRPIRNAESVSASMPLRNPTSPLIDTPITNIAVAALPSPSPNSNFATDHTFQHLIASVLSTDVRAQNTTLCYEPKRKEFEEYCEYRYSSDIFRHVRYIVDHQKVYDFMWYQTLRERRPRGRKRTNDSGLRQYFCPEDFESILEKYRNISDGDSFHPTNPMAIETWLAYISAIKTLYVEQVAQNRNTHHWDFIVNNDVQNLRKYVKTRQPRLKKENYAEKLDYEFAPFTVVSKHKEIELGLWNRGSLHGPIACLSWLRSRYCYLQTFSGVLRCESLTKAELSDLLHVNLQKHSDIHLISLLVLQIATGKTNKGVRLYGRLMRHKDVSLCGFGALGFYLLYRFYITGEMPVDFTNNSCWYDIKLLIKAKNECNKTEMAANTYARKIKLVLDELNITSNHFAHLGRVLGAAHLEFLEADSSDIQELGNWNPSMQKQRYSTKIPMGIIRMMAGFVADNGIHYNPRTTVVPESDLLDMVFPWVGDCWNNVREANRNGSDLKTAEHFLSLMDHLKTIVLQDAAALLYYHPERRNYPLFQMDVFNSEQFSVS